jgi:hypothetical protein
MGGTNSTHRVDERSAKHFSWDIAREEDTWETETKPAYNTKIDFGKIACK